MFIQLKHVNPPPPPHLQICWLLTEIDSQLTNVYSNLFWTRAFLEHVLQFMYKQYHPNIACWVHRIMETGLRQSIFLSFFFFFFTNCPHNIYTTCNSTCNPENIIVRWLKSCTCILRFRLKSQHPTLVYYEGPRRWVMLCRSITNDLR